MQTIKLDGLVLREGDNQCEVSADVAITPQSHCENEIATTFNVDESPAVRATYGITGNELFLRVELLDERGEMQSIDFVRVAYLQL